MVSETTADGSSIDDVKQDDLVKFHAPVDGVDEVLIGRVVQVWTPDEQRVEKITLNIKVGAYHQITEDEFVAIIEEQDL